MKTHTWYFVWRDTNGKVVPLPGSRHGYGEYKITSAIERKMLIEAQIARMMAPPYGYPESIPQVVGRST